MARGRNQDAPTAGASFRFTARARQVLAIVRRDGTVSRAQLIRQTGLSGTAIFRATEELQAEGFVRIGEAVAEGRGQPSAAIHIVPEAAFSLGLSVMTDQAEVALMDLSGKVLIRRDVTREGMRRAAILNAVEDFLAEARAHAGFDRRKLIGMGVAVAGFFVDRAQVNAGAELDDWSLIDLEEDISARLAIPVTVENIASASALGERLLGCGAEYRSFAYLNVATGFGCGLVLDGQLYRGINGNAGEIAILFEMAGYHTPNLVSLRDAARKNSLETAGIADLLARYDDDWPWLDTWVKDCVPAYSFMAAVMRHTLDCDTVIIGGRIPRPLAERLARLMTWPEQAIPARRGRPAKPPVVRVARLPAELAAVLGAASLPMMQSVFA